MRVAEPDTGAAPATPSPPARRILLALPIAVLVFGFTAIPAELRLPDAAILAGTLDVNLDLPDITANILGFVPLGMVLASSRRRHPIALAAGLSLVAEASQLFATGRSPSVLDVVTNVAGAAAGVLASRRIAFAGDRVPIGRRAGLVAAVIAAMCVGLGTRVTPGSMEESIRRVMETLFAGANTGGVTTPGGLEAHWSFDEIQGERARDDSGNGLDAVLVHRPAVVRGIRGDAVGLNGRDQYLDIGNPPALRLRGSMTISAWINSSAFPPDDAVIVSDYNWRGYQLDTTVDQGTRTIGFKLSDDRGQPMARYGRTPLSVNRWYHVAGVYDAQARTLDVYLNGRRDNGCLLGEVSARQRLSGEHVFIGRHGSSPGFEFAGAVDDIRIYSRAVAGAELAAEVERGTPHSSDARSFRGSESALANEPGQESACPPRVLPSAADVRLPGVAVLVGVLTAFAFTALAPEIRYLWSGVAITLAVGGVLAWSLGPVVSSSLQWAIPVLTLAGGASVVLALRPTSDRASSRAAPAPRRTIGGLRG